jgi:SPP1 gp7 family putative phage head morphogenesis protein
VPRISQILQRYAEALDEWAKATALRMLRDVDQADRAMWATLTQEQAANQSKQHRARWAKLSQDMSEAIKDELAGSATGDVLRERLAEQVALIKSLPLEAAQRVHELTLRGLETASRGEEIRRAILATGDVTTARATLIARTEVARTASLLTQSRAEFIGSTHYIWRTSGDTDVRPGHRALNGQVFRWDDPPQVLEGEGKRKKVYRHHPGQIWNCRCYPEPIIPE